MSRKFILAAMSLCALGVVSCATKQAPLQGERESILTQQTVLKPDAAVASVDVMLPDPVRMQSWPQVGGYADHAPLHVALNDRVTPGWENDIDITSDYERMLNSAVVEDGLIYVSTGDGVIALNLETGKEVWEKELESSFDEEVTFTGGIAVVGGTLYVTTGTGEVFALTADSGETIWHKEVGAPVRAAPTIDDGRVFVVSHDNRLHVLSAVDGSLQWTHSGIEESAGIVGGAAPAVSNGIAIVAYSSGEVYALRAADGSYLWHEAVSSRSSLNPFGGVSDITAAPVIVGNVVYVASQGGRLVTFDLQNGRQFWAKDIAAQSMPWVSGNHVFVLTDNNELVALNRKRGQVRWVHKLAAVEKDGNVFWQGPVLAGDRLVVVSSNGYAASVSPYSGEQLSLIKVADSLSVTPIVASGNLIFTTDEGDIITFR